MGEAGRNKSNSETPRIVIHPSVFGGKDERLKVFIDEWLVPALVEDYISSHCKPFVSADGDTDSDSQDLQRPISIEDQVRLCTEFAAKQGWAVVDEFVRCDEARSAATVMGRDALNALMVSAKTKPKPFDCLLVDDTSRLARFCLGSAGMVSSPHCSRPNKSLLKLLRY